MKMRYCKRCLQPDTRPGIVFDDEQICFACRYQESKAHINWEERHAELVAYAEEAKAEAKKRGNTYDCIIGVSGGKDSTFQAIYAKEKLGLNPLLINCMPDEITEIGRKNIENLNNLGFDIISIRPNPIVAKKLARKSFFDRCNIIAASEYCLWASAYIMAVKFNIPFIIQGENAALTLGAAKNQETTGNAFSVMQLETIRGASVNSFVDLSNNITEKDLFLYKIPTVEEMEAKGIRAIFLQYYVPEWSQVTNADFAVARGLTGRSGNLHDLGRYRRYTALDCDLQIPNQMIKYLKFGFGYATDEICYDIREGRFSREDGKWYVNEYDGQCGEQYIQKACDYLSITKEEFWEVVDKFVNRDLFEKKDGKWVPKFTVGEDYES
ncbi:N-acetyl sugar amidotransferase [Butyrivibrio sp. YAB3001]|uniref:N-acetyl sugar amidotransferase n=1 Tax=Butyrivibrio sp. YAB3001 TaxID=1520812 RepID=UPI0008F6636E|nr:N-acetyl sugar amidotransferase [Butyrivibrio sp. YAB3001]SFC17156.1 N-acetyl sugar amidotransferase [Butyrivibrio sp. YAB3001]